MKMTKAEAAKYLEDFLSGRGNTWDWDDFISIRLDDPELERIRLKCGSLPDVYPPERPGQYCSDRGLAILEELLVRLRE